MRRTLRTYAADVERRRSSPSILDRMRAPLWKKAKEERERLMRFATCAGASRAYLEQLSFVVDFATPLELRRLRAQIQSGQMGDVFPIKSIARARERAAEDASRFLGKRMLMHCIRNNGKMDIEGKKDADAYLGWAGEHGAKELRALAIAGLISVCAKEFREKSDFGRTHFLATSNGVKAIKRCVGSGDAEYLVRQRAKGPIIGNVPITTMWCALGGMACSGYRFVGGISSGWFDSVSLLAFTACSLVAVASIEIARALSLPALAKEVGKLLGQKAEL